MTETSTDTAPTVVGRWLDDHAYLPRLERELLLTHHLGLTRAALLAAPDRPIDALALARLSRDAARLAAGEPLAYVLGEWGFWDLTLEVSPAVLVPRPETETLVDAALTQIGPGDRVLDLGTGSGAIAIVIARETAANPVAVHAVERSEDALALARANAARYRVSIEFHAGDWFEPVSGRFDVIVSNPPYVAAGDPHMAGLRYEPADALVGGPDGLEALTRIVDAAPDYLTSGGWLLVEHGYDQAAAVAKLFKSAGFVDVTGLRDLGGRSRVAMGRTPAEVRHG